MSDNDKRKTRVLELGSQAKLFLDEATNDYELFQAETEVLNKKLADLYVAAGLTPPPPKSVEILKAQGTGLDAVPNTVAIVLEVIADIALFVSITRSLGPPAAKFLAQTRKMPANLAEKVVLEKSITIYEDALGASRGVGAAPEVVEIEITGADVAGHVLAGIVAGVAVGVLDGIIWASEEAELKSHLTDAITALHPLRTSMLIAKRYAASARHSLQTVDAMVEALNGHDEKTLQKVLADPKSAGGNAVVKCVNKILGLAGTPATVAADLKKRDTTNRSYTQDDPAYQV